LIDSTIVTGLSELGASPRSGVFSWSSVKISFLELASSCVTTPWNDGASSSIVNILIQAARKHEADVDEKVSMAAKAALRLCDATGVPRAPALLYVSRTTTANATSAPRTDTSASDLIKNIQNARVAASEARKAVENVEKAKKEKAEEKRQREEQKAEENAAKRKKTELNKEALEKVDHLPKDLSINKKSASKPAEPTEGKHKQEGKSSKELVSVAIAKSDESNPDYVVDQKDSEKDAPRDSQGDLVMKESQQTVEVEKSTKTDEKMEVQDSDDDEDDAFPDIVEGGPDSSDDE
jgi:hypothetical protein